MVFTKDEVDELLFNDADKKLVVHNPKPRLSNKIPLLCNYMSLKLYKNGRIFTILVILDWIFLLKGMFHQNFSKEERVFPKVITQPENKKRYMLQQLSLRESMRSS